MAVTFEAALERLGGVISSGSHSAPNGSCMACAVECVCLMDMMDGKRDRWTDDPTELGIPDVRPINDAYGEDVARTAAMSRLIPLLLLYRDWDNDRKVGFTKRLALRTVRELLPKVLRPIGLEKEAVACETATDLDSAARSAADSVADSAYSAAEAARSAAYSAARSARSAADSARSARSADSAEAARSAARSARSAAEAAYSAAREILDFAVQIWCEELAKK